MTVPSYEKVNYLLRPSKQIERKLIVEALHKLALGGLDVGEYTYVGLGSVYFADFQLFHKYLYIDNMTCVESAPIPRRMNFNRPFSFIKLQMSEVAAFIPQLHETRRYFVWLDYDAVLNEDMLADIKGCLHRLCPGSAFLVTVDVDPERLGLSGDAATDALLIGPVIERLRGEFGKYYPHEVTNAVASYNRLPRFFATVLRSLIGQEVSVRAGMKFLQLFNFRYADGSQMLSLGGILANDRVENDVRRSRVYELPYVSKGATPLAIAVPLLTVRERQWLDRNIRWATKPSKIAFEIDDGALKNFRRYYKHYPTYYETLL